MHPDPAERRAGRPFALTVAAATAAGAALRMQDLGRDSLWFDEIVQFDWLDASPSQALANVFQKIDPPLSGLIAYLWNHSVAAIAPALARDEIALRIPAVALGIATIPLLAFAARAALGRAAGALAAVLLAVNPYHIRYSQEARYEALLVLIVSGALLLTFRVLQGDLRARNVGILGALFGAATLTHPFAVLFLGACLAATLWARRGGPDPRLARLLRAEAIGLAVSVPYLVYEAIVAGSGPGHYTYLYKLDTKELAQIAVTGRRFSVFYLDRIPMLEPVERSILAATVAALGLLAILGAFGRREGEARWLRLHLLAAALVPPVALSALSMVRPVYQDRYVIVALPALALLAARARPQWLAPLLAAFPVLTGVWVAPRYHAHLRKADFREAVDVVAADCRPGDSVTMGQGHHLVFDFYVKRRGEPGAPISALSRRAAETSLFVSPDPADATTSRILDEPRSPEARLYVIDTPEFWETIGARATAGPARWRMLYEAAPIPNLRVWRIDS